MSALTHFPYFFSLSTHKPFSPPLPSVNRGILHLHHHHHRRPSICASSVKKPRARRKAKSDEDLCNDIREFVSAVGLPEGHVPYLKELSQHGRQDLANIVRRRGYKVIKELLATSTKSDGKESVTVKDSVANQHGIGECEYEPKGQNEEVEVSADDVCSLDEDTIKHNHFNIMNGATADFSFTSHSKTCVALESSVSSSLQEKVAKFIQNGVVDAVEDDSFGIVNEMDADDRKGFIESENVTKELTSQKEKPSNWELGRSDTAGTLNVMPPTKQVALPALGNNSSREDVFSSEGSLGADGDEELDVEVTTVFHQKELELSQLNEQIENEKLALAHLLSKAETEISKAQKLISEKDADLYAAEQSLSGLEEVKVQYWGDGETVEVAGSFNGWHHRIKMDPQPSSSIIDPVGSRKSQLWTTVLWLYPGIYEIKFIVDGHWRIDPQRESITKGTFQNNVLRVDR